VAGVHLQAPWQETGENVAEREANGKAEEWIWPVAPMVFF